MEESYLAKIPGIRNVVDKFGVVYERVSTIILKGSVGITPTAKGLELDFTGGPGGGSGDVSGPASATTNRLPLFADGTGKVLIDSGQTITQVIATAVAAATPANGALGWVKLAAAIGNLGFTGLRLLAYNGEVDNPTSTFDFTTGALQKKTLAANTTLATPTPPPPFTDVRIRVAQPSSGGTYTYTLGWWAGIAWDGGVAPTMPTGAGTELIVGGYHDGTTWRLSGPPPSSLSLAQNRLAGRGSASGTGALEAITPGGGTELNGTTLQLSSQLPARGGENVIVDLYPSTQQQGTINTGASVNVDVAIAAGKRYKIVADVWCDDGAGGACQFAKAIAVVAHQTGGAAVPVTNDSTHDNLGAGWTFTAAASTTNIRFTLSNSSGTNRTYNIAIGYFAMDKP